MVLVMFDGITPSISVLRNFSIGTKLNVLIREISKLLWWKIH